MKTYQEFITEAKKAYVTVGIPGSGKSTIVKHMRSKDPSIGHHELDKSRKALGKGPAYFGADLVQHQNKGIESDAKKGNTVVVSNTALPKAHRDSSLNQLKDLGYDAKAVVLPTTPRAARRRNRNRQEGRVPDFVMSSMSRQRKGINTNPRGGGALSRKELRAGRKEFKKLHRKYRFTKPAMKRSGAIS
jgi:predicted kinase